MLHTLVYIYIYPMSVSRYSIQIPCSSSVFYRSSTVSSIIESHHRLLLQLLAYMPTFYVQMPSHQIFFYLLAVVDHLFYFYFYFISQSHFNTSSQLVTRKITTAMQSFVSQPIFTPKSCVQIPDPHLQTLCKHTDRTRFFSILYSTKTLCPHRIIICIKNTHKTKTLIFEP